MAGLKILRYYDFNDGDDAANGLVMSDIYCDDDDDDDGNDDIRGDGVGVGAWNQIWDDSLHWTVALSAPTLGFSSVSTLHIISLFGPGAHLIAFIQISIQLKSTSFSLTAQKAWTGITFWTSNPNQCHKSP